jgi:5-methylcytosine-specific restriction endonuclease McrA
MNKISRALRGRVRRRARGFCEYCRSCAELTGHEFMLDHVVPEARGGTSQFSNLCWSCFWCNVYNQARIAAPDPRTGHSAALFNPRADSWDHHFRWSSDATRIIGRTAVGRATVKALRLNRPMLIAARRVWVRHDLHPPE